MQEAYNDASEEHWEKEQEYASEDAREEAADVEVYWGIDN